MMWAIKMFCKAISYLFLLVFSIVLTIVSLPFYLVYRIFGGKPLKADKPKKSNGDSWRDRYDWVAGWW